MPREIEIIPFANNDLDSDYLYSQREYYVSSSEVYPAEDDRNNILPRPLDIWYERPYWGKVDTKGRLVFPDSDKLLQVGNGLTSINFISNAYDDFKNFALDARNRLRTSMTSFIEIDNPKKHTKMLF